jgi:hypothetical protein
MICCLRNWCLTGAWLCVDLMPNGHGDKQYGAHDYGNTGGTSDCAYGCGCWMGPSRSGGRTGLDPFGECPNNPKDGKFLGGDADYAVVVEQRIRRLESENYRLKTAVKMTGPDKQDLAAQLEAALTRVAALTNKLAHIRDLAQ